MAKISIEFKENKLAKNEEAIIIDGFKYLIVDAQKRIVSELIKLIPQEHEIKIPI